MYPFEGCMPFYYVHKIREATLTPLPEERGER